MPALEELVGGKEGVISPGTLVLEHRAAALRMIDESSDPACFSFIVAVGGGDDTFGRCIKLVAQSGAIGLACVQFGSHSGRKTGQLRGELLDTAPGQERASFLALALEQLSKPELGDEIGAIKRQRLIKRGTLASSVLRKSARVGKVAPQRSGLRIGGSGAGEGGSRGLCIAVANRSHALGIGGAGSVGIGGRHGPSSWRELPRGASLRRLPHMTAALLADPEWFAHRYVEGDDAFRLIRLARGEHAEMPFLTDDYLGTARPFHDISATDCLSALGRGELHFLFHSAFCGSTLLARALDRPGLAMGLSEPLALNDVVGFRRRGAPPPAVARLADGALRLLARPFGAGEAVVVKPSNLLNPLAELLMAIQNDAKAVFLFAPLETFLISVVRKGLHCRIWVRELLEGYLREGYVDLGFAADDYFKLSDLQVAAVGWLAQHARFGELAAKLDGRIGTLDANLMTARPAEAISVVAAHYGLIADAATVAEIVAGPAFGKHSKSGAAFDAGQRSREYAAARSAHGEEIGMVLAWAEKVAEVTGVSMTAPNPLLQE